MATIFHGWGNTNELRNYPLVDGASKVGVGGKELPDDVLADLNLWVPRSAGERAFVASVVISSQLVTVTFAAFGVPAVPLGVVSLERPVEAFRNYPVEATYPGVGGWVMFGSALTEQDGLSVVVNNPEATEILPRLLRPYDDLPLQSVGKQGVLRALSGIVGLVAGRDVTIVSAIDEIDPASDYLLKPTMMRQIKGVPTPAIVYQLDGNAEDYQTQYGYTGPCGPRPDADNCPRSLIKSINGVEPDCDGNIQIVVEGDVPNGVLVDGDGTISGMVIDYILGLTDVCDRDPTGRYREIIDLCEASSSLSSESSEEPESSSSSSSSPFGCGDILPPHVQAFELPGDDSCMDVRDGAWGIISCGYQGVDFTGMGVSCLFGTRSYGQQIRTQIYLPEPVGDESRGALVFCHENDNRFAFVELDLVRKELSLRRWTGLGFITYYRESIPSLQPHEWYNLRVDVSENRVVQVYFEETLVVTRRMIVRDGRVGFMTRESQAVFDLLTFGIEVGTSTRQCIEYSSSSSSSSSSGGA